MSRVASERKLVNMTQSDLDAQVQSDPSTIARWKKGGNIPQDKLIESRSGGALEVVAMDFEPLEGATELFGEWAPSVWLEALAGEGASTPDVRFSLGGARVEQDAAALAPFALPDGFGSRVPVSYRFDIPDDALGAIDAGRFDGATTSACSVAYTVALA